MAAGKVSDGRGLFNYEIEAYMKKYPEFLGVVPSDKVSELKPNGDRIAFIVNLDNSGEPGSHWVSVFVSNDPFERSVEYFDSFGNDAPADIKNGIRQLVKKMNTNFQLLFKVNRVQHQFNDTASCGLHAINFLEKRIIGIPFVDATGFTDLKKFQMKKREKEVEQIEEKFNEFI